MNNGPSLAEYRSIIAEHILFYTICSGACKSLLSTVANFVRLAIHYNPFVTENLSNIAKITALQWTIRDSEHRMKETAWRVKIAEPAAHTASEIALTIFIA